MPTISIPYTPRKIFKPLHITPWQQACIVAHRRAGKTVASIREVERRALKNTLPKPRYAYIAPQYKQGKKIAWEYLKIGYEAFKRVGARKNESELKVVYPNEAEFQIYGADNPDSLRGIYLDGVIYDEYAYMKESLREDVIGPALADRMGFELFIGTPGGRNQFYHIHREAERNPEWLSLVLRASETGILSPQTLAKYRAQMSEARYNREFECSFDVEGASQFISAASLTDCFYRKFNPLGLRVIGVDPARYGDARTAIVTRLGNTLKYEAHNGLNTVQIVGRVLKLINDVNPQAVFIDEIALGAGVVDMLQQPGTFVGGCAIIGINGGKPAIEDHRFKNLRAECWWKMREWLQRHAALQRGVEDFIDDVTGVEYDYDLQGRLIIESKEDMAARGMPSPDIGDALSVTFAMPLMAEAAGLVVPDRLKTSYAVEPEDPFGSYAQINDW